MTEPKKPRANYSMEFKLAMVEKSLQPGVSVALLRVTTASTIICCSNGAAVIGTSPTLLSMKALAPQSSSRTILSQWCQSVKRRCCGLQEVGHGHSTEEISEQNM
ncbi:transposase [Sodalis glossinidius]